MWNGIKDASSHCRVLKWTKSIRFTGSTCDNFKRLKSTRATVWDRRARYALSKHWYMYTCGRCYMILVYVPASTTIFFKNVNNVKNEGLLGYLLQSVSILFVTMCVFRFHSDGHFFFFFCIHVWSGCFTFSLIRND